MYTIYIEFYSNFLSKDTVKLTRPTSEAATSNCAKKGNGYAKIQIVTIDYKVEFTAINAEQIFTVPVTGTYKLETWGAQGGGDNLGGYGGYSFGNVYLNKNDELYINVGTHPTTINGGYNGGGTGKSREGTGYGGSSYLGTDGSFGQGGSAQNNFGAGAGGGLYGGGGAGYNQGVVGSGGGGSGYIGNPLLTNKVMYCYNCTSSTETNTKTMSTTCTEETATSNCAKKGNGYAIITYIS